MADRRTPAVTVVVPSFQQGSFLERTLASIRAQQDVDVELVVVDACSTDETRDVLERWSVSIDLLVVEPDDGQADAIAKGLSRSTAPFATWLNADDAYAGPDALATLARWLERRPDVDVVYGRRIWIDEAGSFLRLDRWKPFDGEALRRACYLPQESALFRRTSFDGVGGIDREFRFALDYDLWLRILDAGGRFLSVPDVVGMFRVHDAQKSTAAWVEVGLPEIARLQERHAGEVVDEDEMVSFAEAWRAGVDASVPPESQELQRDLTAILNGHLAGVLGDRPLDRWALAEPPVPVLRPTTSPRARI